MAGGWSNWKTWGIETETVLSISDKLCLYDSSPTVVLERKDLAESQFSYDTVTVNVFYAYVWDWIVLIILYVMQSMHGCACVCTFCDFYKE